MSSTTSRRDLPPLKLHTPKSATFPSEILESPLPSLTNVKKIDAGLKTPITPPLAYTEFLKALTPVLTSPAPLSAIPRSLSEDSSGGSTPASEPSTASSVSCCKCEKHKSPAPSFPPPSPFAHPKSARTPTGLRRLRIPQSPLCSPSANSPGSCAITGSAMSATVPRSPFSAADWNLEGHRYFDAPRSACVRPVSIRSVVTRTVTYKPTSIDPAPKGKKRKVDQIEGSPPPVTAPPVSPPTAVV